MADDKPVAPPRHEPGVYFDMPAEEYHADPALGSGDVRSLKRNGLAYWHNSWMNPTRKPDEGDTPSRILGRAIHAVTLEGEDVFDRQFTRRADDAPGASQADKGNLTKAENKRAAIEGKLCLPGDAYDRAVITGAMIRLDPELQNAFEPTGGRSEVSVFWNHERTVAGKKRKIPCKARFDKLRPRAIGDLKSIANELGLDLPVACYRHISSYRYDIQASHYLEARAALPALVKSGKVFGCRPMPEDTSSDAFDQWKHYAAGCMEFAGRVAAERDFAFVLVFYQTTGAPDTFGVILSPQNPMVADIAGRRRAVAMETFVRCSERFGADRWVESRPLRELDVSDMPAFYDRE